MFTSGLRLLDDTVAVQKSVQNQTGLYSICSFSRSPDCTPTFIQPNVPNSMIVAEYTLNFPPLSACHCDILQPYRHQPELADGFKMAQIAAKSGQFINVSQLAHTHRLGMEYYIYLANLTEISQLARRNRATSSNYKTHFTIVS